MKYKTNELDDYETIHRRCLLEQRVSNIALPQAQLKATSPTRKTFHLPHHLQHFIRIGCGQ
jgi:hypothetical protein